MMNHYIKVFILLFIIPVFCISAVHSNVPTEKDKLLEELTGKSNKKNISQQQLQQKNKSLSERHLMAGMNAFKNKNYILALKHYNTVIIKYKNSAEVKSAYLQKEKLYNVMGLKEQAQRNARLALQQSQPISKKMVK